MRVSTVDLGIVGEGWTRGSAGEGLVDGSSAGGVDDRNIEAFRAPEALGQICGITWSAPCGSVANLLFREFYSLQVIELPMPGFRILPPKLKFATEPSAPAISDWKNFLRLKIDKTGLTVYPIDIQRVPRRRSGPVLDTGL